MDKPGPYCINSDTVHLEAWDTVKTGGCLISPGFLIYVQLDYNSADDDSITLYQNGNFWVTFNNANSWAFQNFVLLEIYSWECSPDTVFSVKFCDDGKDGGCTIPYEIYDRPTHQLFKQGNFVIGDTGGCITIVFPRLKGIAKFKGPGVISNSDGTGIFIPKLAGPGTHVIKYYWNNEAGLSDSASTTVVVGGMSTATISGTINVCLNSPSPNITFTGGNGTAPYTFTYTVNGGGIQRITTVGGNSITVSVPTGTAGTYVYNLLNVADVSGCSQSQNGTATVIVNPLPTASISGTTTVCQNSASPNITFTGTNGTAPFTFTYTINGGANQTVTSAAGNTATVAVPTGNTGTYIYTLINVSDNNVCSQAQGGSATVIVNPSPAATISGTISVCQNSASPNVTFTGSNGIAPYTFTYSVNGGAIQTVTTTVGNSVTVSVPTGTAGTYDYLLITVSDNSGCSQVQNGMVVVQVNPLPTATISGTVTICQNSASPDITFTGMNGTVPYTFTYSINGGANQTIITTAGNSVTIAAPTGTTGNYVYTLVSVADNNGCTQAQAGSVTVIVNISPTATINGAITVCQNSASPNITFTGANGTAPYTFTYTINGGANQTMVSGAGNTATLAVPTGTAGIFVYALVKVSDNNGCSQAQNGSVTITVNQIPIANAGSNSTICKGDSVTIGTAAVGGETYDWSSNPAGYSSKVSNPTVKPTITTDYTVTVSSNGCTNTAGVTVAIINSPDISIKPNPAYICTGGAITLSASGADTYTWFPPDGLNSTVGANVTASPVINTAYTVTGILSGCPGKATVSVDVSSSPVADFTIEPELVLVNNSVSFTDKSYGTPIPVKWHWSLGNGDTSNLPGFNYKYNQPGKYQVTLIVYNQYGCSDSKSEYVTAEDEYKLFVPNAFMPDNMTDNTFLAYAKDILDFKMEVFNRWGMLLFESENVSIGWDGTCKGNPQPQGLYVYIITFKDASLTKHHMLGKITLIR